MNEEEFKSNPLGLSDEQVKGGLKSALDVANAKPVVEVPEPPKVELKLVEKKENKVTLKALKSILKKDINDYIRLASKQCASMDKKFAIGSFLNYIVVKHSLNLK